MRARERDLLVLAVLAQVEDCTRSEAREVLRAALAGCAEPTRDGHAIIGLVCEACRTEGHEELSQSLTMPALNGRTRMICAACFAARADDEAHAHAIANPPRVEITALAYAVPPVSVVGRPRPKSYAEACTMAATDQGLDPISAALTAAEVPHVIEQTGGFCMVLHVYTDPADLSRYIGITAGDTDGTYFAGVMEGEDAELFEPIAEEASAEEVVRAVRAELAKPKPHRDYDTASDPEQTNGLCSDCCLPIFYDTRRSLYYHAVPCAECFALDAGEMLDLAHPALLAPHCTLTLQGADDARAEADAARGSATWDAVLDRAYALAAAEGCPCFVRTPSGRYVVCVGTNDRRDVKPNGGKR